MLEAAVANLKAFGRVALCGVISEYTSSKKAAPKMLDLVYKRIKVEGFLAGDFLNVYSDFIAMASQYLGSGKIESLEDVSIGVDTIPSAFIGLFKGDNIGKKMVKLAVWQNNNDYNNNKWTNWCCMFFFWYVCYVIQITFRRCYKYECVHYNIYVLS